MILSNRSMCMIPHQSIILPPFSLSLVWLFVEFRVGNDEVAYSGRTCCKVKDRIQQRKQVIQSDQDVHVCGIFVAGTRIPLLQNCPFYLLLRYELSFIFLSSFFSSHAFWGTDIYIFFFFFYIAQIFLHDEYKEFCQKRNGAFLWMEGIYLRNFQCRSQHMSG